jgi:hypothetical protein
VENVTIVWPFFAKNMNALKVFIFSMAIICWSCEKSPFQAQAEIEVGSFLTNGLPRDIVIQKWGDPLTHEKIGGSLWEDTYLAKLGNKAIGWTNKFSGVEIRYENGRVSRWDPIYSDQIISH